MKHLSILFFFSIFLFTVTAQVAPPEAINYSGVARDANGDPIISSTIGLQLSILQTTATGAMVYQENHSAVTDEYGRFSVALGMGTVQSGTFSNIDWGSDSHFLQVGLDPAGGTTFQLMGTTQMLSVPYALYAKEAGTVNSLGNITISQMGDTLFNGTDTLIIPGISSANGGNSYYTPGGGVTDIDGNTYSTIIMANGQEWMAENLRTTKYANGDDIPNVSDNTDWSNLTTGGWCWFDNDGTYDLPRGKLYNRYSAVDPRNLCPTDWHVPSMAEIRELINFCGGFMQSGGMLKLPGPWWGFPEIGGSNESGFSAYPTGYRVSYSSGSFQGLDSETRYWGSDSYQIGGNSQFSGFGAVQLNEGVSLGGGNQAGAGLPVRCIKD